MSLSVNHDEASVSKKLEPTSKPKEILVVDDDEQIQYLLTELLRHYGYHVTCRPDVKSALEDLGKERPDLVLLDLCMRGTDGTAFLKNAQQYLPKGLAVLPIIILSVLQDKEIVDFTLQNGAVAYIAKPFDPKRLIETVEAYFSAYSSGRCDVF